MSSSSDGSKAIAEWNVRAGPRIQREFITWYQQNAERFLLPIFPLARSRKQLDFHFIDISRVVSASLRANELTVKAEMDGINYDYLLSIDLSPTHSQQGYVCELCEPVDRKIYRTRTEFLRQHMFEPFLEWVNGVLVLARWIALYSINGTGTTWAKLINDGSQLIQPNRQSHVRIVSLFFK